MHCTRLKKLWLSDHDHLFPDLNFRYGIISLSSLGILLLQIQAFTFVQFYKINAFFDLCQIQLLRPMALLLKAKQAKQFGRIASKYTHLFIYLYACLLLKHETSLEGKHNSL